MSDKKIGNFILGESTFTQVEAGIYEARRGKAETSLCSFTFENGEEIKVRSQFSVEIGGFNIVEETEEGEIVIQASGNGNFEIYDDHSQVLFEGQWKGDEKDTHIAVRNHIIVDLKVAATFNGVGKNEFDGKKINGLMEGKQNGVDASGLGIFILTGKGQIN